MTIPLAYVFRFMSGTSARYGSCGAHNMRRRKSTRSEVRRSLLNHKRASIQSRLLDVSRRPVTFAVAIGFAAAIVGYMIMRGSESSNTKRNTDYSSRTAERKVEIPAGLPTAPVVKAKVVEEYDHDPDAFTQGLVFHEGYFYESTGLMGRSSIRKVDLATGSVVDTRKLPASDFGEGLALTGEDLSRVIQVLWKVGKAYVYDRESLQEISSFSFEGDAWGLASQPEDPNRIFLSDGSSTIKVLQFEGDRFRTLREITVRDGSRELGLLNELEIIGNELWANVWMCDFIARIDITTGVVKSWIDLRGILRESAVPKDHTTDVLNGIAYDSSSGAVYVTGKQWPKLYHISVTEEKITDDISDLTNAFFLNPDQVAYIMKYVVA